MARGPLRKRACHSNIGAKLAAPKHKSVSMRKRANLSTWSHRSSLPLAAIVHERPSCVWHFDLLSILLDGWGQAATPVCAGTICITGPHVIRSTTFSQNGSGVAYYVHDINNADHSDRAHVLYGSPTCASGMSQLACYLVAVCYPAGAVALLDVYAQHTVAVLQGILHGQARQHLGQLVFYIFVPCLTFTKLASAVDLNNLKVWWPLPVNTALR